VIFVPVDSDAYRQLVILAKIGVKLVNCRIFNSRANTSILRFFE
jgi:hypothetical protein